MPYVEPSGYQVQPAPSREVIPDAEDGTYRYDGGPVNVVPEPAAVPQKRSEPPPARVVPDARYVSQPVKAKKYTFRAYGEKPTAPALESGTLLTRKTR
jgi:hypothetical protein